MDWAGGRRSHASCSRGDEERAARQLAARTIPRGSIEDPGNLERWPVAYRGGGPALVDLIGERGLELFEGITSSIEYVRSGKLRALAVTAATRSAALPDVPTIGEFVPGYDGSGWIGIGAPKATPVEIVEKLNKEINAGLNTPKFAALLQNLGGVPAPMSPAGLSSFIASETERWAKVVKLSGAKPE